MVLVYHGGGNNNVTPVTLSSLCLDGAKRCRASHSSPFQASTRLLLSFKTRPVCWYLMSESRPQAGGSSFSFCSCCLSCQRPSPLTPDRPLWQSSAARSHLTLPTATASPLKAAHPPPRCSAHPPTRSLNLHYNRRWARSGLGWGAREGKRKRERETDGVGGAGRVMSSRLAKKSPC